MAGWMDCWMAGCMDRWMDGWIDGWMDTHTHTRTHTHPTHTYTHTKYPVTVSMGLPAIERWIKINACFIQQMALNSNGHPTLTILSVIVNSKFLKRHSKPSAGHHVIRERCIKSEG